MKYVASILLMFFLLGSVHAQGQSSQLTDSFYTSGKIYVVTGCLLLIFAGVIFYLVRLDKKIKRLEKDMEDHRS